MLCLNEVNFGKVYDYDEENDDHHGICDDFNLCDCDDYSHNDRDNNYHD